MKWQSIKITVKEGSQLKEEHKLENGRRRAIAKNDGEETYLSAYQCTKCIARQEYRITDVVLIQVDINPPKSQGWIRNTANSGCTDCKIHKRNFKNVPDYAEIFDESLQSERSENPFAHFLEDPNPNEGHQFVRMMMNMFR
tara:strand:+ start:1917 stop:2339 length:423 start_codon:yes stop_codon:yes gene_type:complete